MKALVALFFIVAGINCSYALETPVGLTAEWSGNNEVTLNWVDNSSDEQGFIIQRRIGRGTTWSTLTTTGQNATTFIDPGLTGSTYASDYTVYIYRVRAKNATLTGGTPPAEVVIAGIASSATSESSRDTDADGLLDSVDANPTDWTDGTADSDGDLIPNAWEGATDPSVTVDPSAQTQTADVVWTISAALTKLNSTTAHPNNATRIIRVKPGVYRENIEKSQVCNIALLPLRTSSSDHFEIQGVHATDPVISVTKSAFVIDGFHITRAPGTKGPALLYSEEVPPASTNQMNRWSIVRMVNCIVSNMDVGTESVVVHPRGRLVLSHCTFYMNWTSVGSLAQSYKTGLVSGTAGLETTARMAAQNCIFWNPVTTLIPEIQSVGPNSFTTCIAYQSSAAGMPTIPAGCSYVVPGLTPKGYIGASTSLANDGGTANLGVIWDIHGEERLDPTSRGADEWYDLDADGIPDFADLYKDSDTNSFDDGDADGLSDLVEYLSGTNLFGADSPYLTLPQAQALFVPQTGGAGAETYYTKSEANGIFQSKADMSTNFYNKTQSDARYLLRSDVLRIDPAGDISMGEFAVPAP